MGRLVNGQDHRFLEIAVKERVALEHPEESLDLESEGIAVVDL